jgi:hypothetical protein
VGVYLAIYSILALKAVGNYSRRQTLYFPFAAIFLVWFMGFRYETGCDYYGYLNRWINFSPWTSPAQLLEGTELGFEFLTLLVKSFGLDYTWLNVAVSAILVFCYLRFASFHAFSPLILALLFPIIIIQLGMSGIRQALAGGFLMLAFNSFVRKEKLWTAIWILVGSQFHVSVIIFLPIAYLAGRTVDSIRLTTALIFLGPIASLLLANRLDTYSDRYGDGEITSGGATIRYLLIFLPIPFFIAYKNKIRQEFSNVYPLLKLSVIIIISLSPLLVLSSIALHRLNYYIFPLSILLCVYVGSIILRKPYQGHWLVIGVYGLYSATWFLFSKHARLCYLPYQNTWFM